MNAEATVLRDQRNWKADVLVLATAFGSLPGACVTIGVMRMALQRRGGGLLAFPWLDTDTIADFAIGVPVLVAGGIPIGEVFGQ